MRTFIGLLSCFFLLAGCSYISVDEKDIESEKKITSSDSSNKVLDDSLSNVIEDFFLFEWYTAKELEAKPLFYLALGDSLTKGVGDETNNYGFTGLLAQELNKWPAISEVELDNRGKNGRRSDQLLALMEDGQYDKELNKTDLITITLGGNDVMKVVKEDLFNLDIEMFKEAMPPFVERYEQIVKYIREKTNAPIILVGFYNPFKIITDEYTPFETIIGDWNNEIESLAKNTENACFVHIEDLFTSNVDMVYHTDFFHPNANGYERMAERVKQSLTDCNIQEMSDGLIGFEE